MTINTKLERLQVDMYDSRVKKDLLYKDWVEEYLNPFISLLIKEDQLARMGAVINIDYHKDFRILSKKYSNEELLKELEEEGEQEFVEWINKYDAFNKGISIGKAKLAKIVKEILEK